MVKKFILNYFCVRCPHCGSEDYFCLGGHFYQCRDCGCQWNEEETNL